MIFDERLRDRFWRMVNIGGPDDCWDFQGAINGNGYGMIRVRRDDGSWVSVAAHRVSAKLAGFNIDGVLTCHKCDNRKCCNPAHLFSGTYLANAQDMVAKGRHRPTAHGKGGRHGQFGQWRKLSDTDVSDIRIRFQSGDTQVSLAKEHGVSHACINHIVHGRRRRAA